MSTTSRPSKKKNRKDLEVELEKITQIEGIVTGLVEKFQGENTELSRQLQKLKEETSKTTNTKDKVLNNSTVKKEELEQDPAIKKLQDEILALYDRDERTVLETDIRKITLKDQLDSLLKAVKKWDEKYLPEEVGRHKSNGALNQYLKDNLEESTLEPGVIQTKAFKDHFVTKVESGNDWETQRKRILWIMVIVITLVAWLIHQGVSYGTLSESSWGPICAVCCGGACTAYLFKEVQAGNALVAHLHPKPDKDYVWCSCLTYSYIDGKSDRTCCSLICEDIVAVCGGICPRQG